MLPPIWWAVFCILAQRRTSRNDLMTQLAILDEEKEDREIPPAFVPQLRDYGLAGTPLGIVGAFTP